MIQKIKNLLVKNRRFIISIILLFAVRWSFADHYGVPSGSMLPTIQIGDHLFVNKIAYDLKLPFSKITLMKTSDPQRGDIIVFEYPNEPSINYVKRLIGLPGDKIEILNGFIKINGKLTLKTPQKIDKYQNELSTKQPFTYKEKLNNKTFTTNRIPQKYHPMYQKFIVPEGNYFFMGDNRDNSADSRYWGFVKRKRLLGKVIGTTYSMTFDNFIPHINIHRFVRKII